MVRNVLFTGTYMDVDRMYDGTTSLSDAENWLALGSGALLLFVGASRRSAVGALLAASSATPAVSRHHGALADTCKRLHPV